MFMKYSIVTRIYTEILINQAVDNFTSSRFRESRLQGKIKMYIVLDMHLKILIFEHFRYLICGCWGNHYVIGCYEKFGYSKPQY